MHSGYKILEDGSINTINEKMQESKHDSNINQPTEEVLLTENKIEMINDKIGKINKKLTDQKGVIVLANGMMKFQPLIVILFTIFGGIFEGLSNMATFSTSALYGGCQAFVVTSLIAITQEIYYGIAKKVYKKKIKGTTSELEKANSLKQQFEKELSKLKEIKNNNDKIETNKKVSLAEKNHIINVEIDNELKNAYDECYKSKTKKLTFKK